MRPCTPPLPTHTPTPRRSADEALLATLPPDMLAEAQALRERMSRSLRRAGFLAGAGDGEDVPEVRGVGGLMGGGAVCAC